MIHALHWQGVFRKIPKLQIKAKGGQLVILAAPWSLAKRMALELFHHLGNTSLFDLSFTMYVCSLWITCSLVDLGYPHCLRFYSPVEYQPVLPVAREWHTVTLIGLTVTPLFLTGISHETAHQEVSGISVSLLSRAMAPRLLPQFHVLSCPFLLLCSWLWPTWIHTALATFGHFHDAVPWRFSFHPVCWVLSSWIPQIFLQLWKIRFLFLWLFSPFSSLLFPPLEIANS